MRRPISWPEGRWLQEESSQHYFIEPDHHKQACPRYDQGVGVSTVEEAQY